MLGPVLGEDDTGLNGFSEAYFVGKDGTFG